MTREETKEAILVMQAYVDGKTVQFKNKKISDVWCDATTKGKMGWNFEEFYYRIKPEPQYRPFKEVEEVDKAIKEHGDWIIRLDSENWKHRIISFSSLRVITGYNYDDDSDGESLDKAFKGYTFSDGTPFGVKEE